MKKNQILLPALIIVFLAFSFSSCNHPVKKSADKMDWWREARFGMFIHWGLYSIPAGEWNGATNHAEWIRTTAQIPIQEYDKLVNQFNPVKFNADDWVKMAKDAGMKYIVITTKHHDGFNLFDSKETDFDVMSTPFKRDIMKEMAAACQKYGIVMCWYHSIMDWHHPDYLPRRDWEKDRPVDSADYERYITYLKSELKELLTKYGKIGVLWFDGEWESTWNHQRGQDLYDYVKSLQPDIIINNRVDVGRGGMAGMNTAGGYAGDFGTPEQEIPPTGIDGVDWESCMTMNDHWGYNKNDKNFKSTKVLVRNLIDIASKGGNFLLNVGPTAEGLFPPESVERLKNIGAWMKVNGEAIYGTHSSPFRNIGWGRCTRKSVDGNTLLYFHIFDWPADGRLLVSGLGSKVKKTYSLADHASLDFDQREGDLLIDLHSVKQDSLATVIVAELKGEPVVYDLPEIQSEFSVFTGSIELGITTKVPGAEIHYTTDGSDPIINSPVAKGNLDLSSQKDFTVKAKCFLNGKPISGTASKDFKLVKVLPACTPGKTQPGLTCTFYAGKWSSLPDFTKLKPVKKTVCSNFKLSDKVQYTQYGLVFEGFVNVLQQDIYQVFLESDDGSRLLVDGEEVINNDGAHGLIEKEGEVALAAGFHKIRVEFFQAGGGEGLNVTFKMHGQPKGPIPSENLFTTDH